MVLGRKRLNAELFILAKTNFDIRPSCAAGLFRLFLFLTIGVRVDPVRTMVLPHEIQYQIDYALADAALFHLPFG